MTSKPTTPTVTVEVVNTYSCGRTSTARETVPAPAEGMTVEDWFQDVVSDYTGDGHECGSHENASYDVEVVEAADAALVGQRWGSEG